MGGRKKYQEKKKPDVNKELDGLDIQINSFGEIQSSFDIDKINKFLNKHVEDKKLKLHPDDEDFKKDEEEKNED